MFSKLFAYTFIFVTGINVTEGQDTIPPTIKISDDQISVNYYLDNFGFDGNSSFLSDDTLEVTLSCIYSFPEEYKFKIENATIEDSSGVLKEKTIIVDNITFYEEGYGKVIQTIKAEDDAGNISKFVIITKYSGREYQFIVNSMRIGGREVIYNSDTHALEDTVFEFCNNQKVYVEMVSYKSGCTGDTRIDWYINYNKNPVKSDSDDITIDLSDYPDEVVELAAEGRYSNTNFQNRIKIKIKHSNLDFSIDQDTIYLNQNKVLTINNTSTTNAHYHWQIGDKTFINDSTQVHYAFESPGNYPIILTDDSGFCNDRIVKNIIVEATTSVLDNLIPSIKIGPNPFTDFLNIDLKKSSDYEITIFGVDGRVYLKNQIYDRGDVQLNLSFLHSGIYVLNINSEENSKPVKDFKIVKLNGN